MRGGADRLGELGLDQRLINGFGGLADTITNIGDLQPSYSAKARPTFGS